MATRLVRLFPVVKALYERVKTRRRQLDQLDLLVKLRDLLVSDKSARAEYQRRFDHIFVDEFQDTDPLQAEIVLYLCEREPRADKWEDVILADGKLTLVGDPKQSIYRFRRADIAMYERVRKVVAKQDHLPVTLSANFRSLPLLIDWFNDRFARILGNVSGRQPIRPSDGKSFPTAIGTRPPREMKNRLFTFCRLTSMTATNTTSTTIASWKGEALARYLRWLVEESEFSIIDSVDGQNAADSLRRYCDPRGVHMALSLLFPSSTPREFPMLHAVEECFCRSSAPPVSPWTRALADRDDGVAEAALLRPPFFAIDLADLLREQAVRDNGSNGQDERVNRARAARELVRELRQRRFDRSPGTTARELLDRTAFARAVALGIPMAPSVWPVCASSAIFLKKSRQTKGSTTMPLAPSSATGSIIPFSSIHHIRWERKLSRC